MSGSYSTRREDDLYRTVNPTKGYRLRNRNADTRIIFELIRIGNKCEGVDWIRLSQDRDRWRAVVSAVMNLRVLAPRR
jgi:hypothetical protein